MDQDVQIAIMVEAAERAATPGVWRRHTWPGSPVRCKFGARLTDVAAMAGLHAPVVYGGVERKEYILEANGCGCAFLDFDDDGWLDVFGLSGTRLEGPPVGATNR